MQYKINSTGAVIVADLAFVEVHYAGDFAAIVEATDPSAPAFKSWPAFDFYRKFTTAERVAIRTLAKTDPIVEDIYATLNAAIASGSNVRDDDPDTVNGLAYLESVGVLAEGRAAEILA